MAEGIKISEFEPIDELQEGCCFPTISNDENRKITFARLTELLFGQSIFNNDDKLTDISVNWNSDIVVNQSAGENARIAKFMRKGNLVQFTIEFTYSQSRYSITSQEIFSEIPDKYKPAGNIYFAGVSHIEYEDSDDDTVIEIGTSRFQITTDGKVNMDACKIGQPYTRIKFSGIYLV